MALGVALALVTLAPVVVLALWERLRCEACQRLHRGHRRTWRRIVKELEREDP